MIHSTAKARFSGGEATVMIVSLPHQTFGRAWTAEILFPDGGVSSVPVFRADQYDADRIARTDLVESEWDRRQRRLALEASARA